MSSPKTYPIREEFLKAFVFSLIQQSYVPTKEDEHSIIKEPTPALIKIERHAPLVPHQIRKRFTAFPPHIPKISTLPRTSSGETINLGKLTQLLVDPSVFSVECPGPDKNVVVNRAGVPQTSAIILTKEEIDKIIDEVSDKTRIPILSGLFKAAFQDLLITAVVSDFVGTRFLIQKRSPFQRY
jgi:hypothetical protein